MSKKRFNVRDTVTGEYVPHEEAEQRKGTTVVEQVKQPLTDARIAELVDDAISTLDFNRPVAVQIARRIARMVEAEHGIG